MDRAALQPEDDDGIADSQSTSKVSRIRSTVMERLHPRGVTKKRKLESNAEERRDSTEDSSPDEVTPEESRGAGGPQRPSLDSKTKWST